MQPSNTINVQPNKMSQLLVLPQLSMPSPLHQHYRFQSLVDNNVSSSTAVNSFRTSLHNEAEIKDTGSGFQPGPFDVICSQGKTAKAHPGNIHFHKVIQKWAKEYSAATEKKSQVKDRAKHHRNDSSKKSEWRLCQKGQRRSVENGWFRTGAREGISKPP